MQSTLWLKEYGLSICVLYPRLKLDVHVHKNFKRVNSQITTCNFRSLNFPRLSQKFEMIQLHVLTFKVEVHLCTGNLVDVATVSVNTCS